MGREKEAVTVLTRKVRKRTHENQSFSKGAPWLIPVTRAVQVNSKDKVLLWHVPSEFTTKEKNLQTPHWADSARQNQTGLTEGRSVIMLEK